jgi:uncharacterized protein
MRAHEHQTLLDVQTEGMHCRSCELLVEKSIQDLPGVAKVQANSDRNHVRIVCDAQHVPTPQQIAAAIKPHGYSVVTGLAQPLGGKAQGAAGQRTREHLSLGTLAGLFAIALAIGFALSKLGLLKFTGEVGQTTGFFAVFALGLVAASSSCLAVSGGLMLSIVASVRERYPQLQARARMVPVSTFVLGRVVGYTLFGAGIAALGKALQPSPLAMGIITILAAAYMLTMGLDMLSLAPPWLKRLMPRMPKTLGHRIVAGSKTGSWAAPFTFGALTFFLPCGFTQALQLYVLSTGSAMTGAVTMFAFALGTAPALLALGWATNVLQGKVGQYLFRLAGAAVILLGFYNFSNGLALTGHPIAFTFATSKSTATADVDPNVTDEAGTQVVKTSFTSSGYTPTSFTVRAGKPVRWEIDGSGNAGGCRSVFQVPAFNVRKLMSNGMNVVEFTPDKPGTYAFSCGMGMYPGTFTVTES